MVSVLISNQYRNENLAVIWVRGGTHFRVLAQRLKEYVYLNSVFGNNVFQRLSNTQWNDAGRRLDARGDAVFGTKWPILVAINTGSISTAFWQRRKYSPNQLRVRNTNIVGEQDRASSLKIFGKKLSTHRV